MAEKVDLLKALKSPFTPVFWIKSIMYLFGIGMILMIGYGFYKAYFKKTEPTQIIQAQPGSNLTLNQPAKDLSKWHLFVAGGAQQREDDHAGWLGLVGVSYDL